LATTVIVKGIKNHFEVCEFETDAHLLEGSDEFFKFKEATKVFVDVPKCLSIVPKLFLNSGMDNL
jgi:hypothetical protein